MKRNILTLVIALFAILQGSAQTYDNLWKQAQTFEGKDLPKSEIGVMQKIINKATVSKDYGQLLAAELRSVVAWGQISNDSIAPALERIEQKANRSSDPVQRAVMYAALGRMYADNANVFSIGEEYKENMKKADRFLAKALENPSLLAQVKSTDYEPLVLQGMDGSSFNHDLLHVVGFEVNTKEAYQMMADYYKKVGNRGAACLCEYQLTQLDRKADVKLVKKSKYLQTIDSLIHVYRDIPEAGELAVEHFRFMVGATDAKAVDKLNYINYALNHWGSWSRMNELRNAQKRLTEPMFLMLKFPKVIRPYQKQWLVFDKVRNLGKLTVNIARLNITADNDYDVNDKNDYKTLLSKTTDLHKISKSLNFVGHPAYEVFKDSMEISDLPLGAYMIEIVSDNPLVPAQRELFYVSDLSFMVQQLPDEKCRYIVVSATNGQPISGATLTFCDRERGNKKQKKNHKYTTDANGEVICDKYRDDVLVATNEDKYTPECSVYAWKTVGKVSKKDVHSISLYTDRSIYRPGQTVRATAICFVRNGDDVHVDANKKVTFSLLDANYKMVAEKSAVSDAYGSASVDLELPVSGLTGNYSLRVNDRYQFIRVEEYKRPTFEVSFPKVNQKYTWGDTVIVKGAAKTYAGVPVQGAKVNYQVTRRSTWWWSRSVDRTICKETGETDADGTFEVKIPLTPDLKSGMTEAEFLKVARFYNFDVSATVTSESGESREGEMSLPLGTRPTAFTVDLPKQVEKDSLRQMSFAYKNSGGMDIAGQVRYRFDGGRWQTAATNTPILLTEEMLTRKSGEHEVEAICEQDTLRQKFVLFSMEDGHPMVFTKHWSYQSAKTFPSDGKPVYLQVGSSENGVYVAYSIVAGGRLLEKGAWDLGDSIITRSFTYQPEYGDGLTLNYCFMKDGVCYSKDLMIAKPLPDKRLNLSWKTFRNRLTPGQKEEWTLQVTTPDGKPAKAQLLSVLYDKSLDQISQHPWNLNLGLYRYLANCPWSCNSNGFYPLALSARYPTKYYSIPSLSIDHFDESKFLTLGIGSYGGALEECVVVGYGVQKKSSSTGGVRIRGMAKDNRMMAAPMTAFSNENVDMNVEQSEVEDANTPLSSKDEKTLDNVQVRENLNETAFFYPNLETDTKGNVAIKFTLPESITTWKFIGLAHDKEMSNGMLMDEAVAQKTVMVQPNMPRFLREGDKASIVAKLFNTSEKKVSGNARMQILDPETNKVVWQKVQKFDIDAHGSTTASFDVEGLKEGIYINKVVATGNGYSDGEQHYLPVLSNRELVTNTLPVMLNEKGEKTFDLSQLFVGKDGKLVENAADAKVTIEYTHNPSWLMIQALPTISNPSGDNAISLMSAIYSNSIARYIMKSSPVIKQVVELWKQESASASSVDKANSSLVSSLEKNQELKNLILSETPWVMDADKESEQKAQLINYFDESQNLNRITSQIAKLKSLQLNGGSFSWWKGMAGNRYMTTAIAKMMVRLNKMIGMQTETQDMLTSALSYLQRETAKEVKNMKKEESKLKTALAKATEGSEERKKINIQLESLRPSEITLEYLYILSLDGRKQTASATSDIDYLIKKMETQTCNFTIYGKAQASVILAKHGKLQKAGEYLQSINEYSVSTPEMGRYFDTRKAYYSWSDYKIPTQVAAIEAIKAQGGNVDDMQLWLLQSKRTQAWDTPINTVDAVYAFMDGKVQALNKTAENASLKLDGKVLDLPKATVGLGYVKVSHQGVAKTLNVDKKNDGISWGAVYVQFTQPSKEIASETSGIKIIRKIENVSDVKVGDKVKVLLSITADRDYDFVQVVDKRAACLEPVNQLSGYRWGEGCYVAPRDNATNFYFDRLSKGRHIVEMEYYVDRKGEYQAGSCSAQCAYSPEFGGRTEAYQLRINN